MGQGGEVRRAQGRLTSALTRTRRSLIQKNVRGLPPGAPSPRFEGRRNHAPAKAGKGCGRPSARKQQRGAAKRWLGCQSQDMEECMRTKPAITLDDAKKMLAAAEAEAIRNTWEVVIAILNDGGRIVAVHRMDGARPGSDEIAIAKATTSAMTCRPSAVWEKWIEGPHKAYATFPFIAAQGGLPIIIEGALIRSIRGSPGKPG